MISRDTPRYHAYLMRCWQDQVPHVTDPLAWRCSLEDPHTGARHGFATFEAVVATWLIRGAKPSRMSQVDPVLNVKGQNRAVLLSSGSITRTYAVIMSPALALP